MTTIKYMDAISLLHSNGHAGLASAAISHYDRMTAGMPPEHRIKVAQMYDEVLGLALERRDEITAEDILISPDFVAIRALARVLQDLGLAETVYELTDLDIVQGDFVETVKPPPVPKESFREYLFDGQEIEIDTQGLDVGKLTPADFVLSGSAPKSPPINRQRNEPPKVLPVLYPVKKAERKA